MVSFPYPCYRMGGEGEKAGVFSRREPFLSSDLRVPRRFCHEDQCFASQGPHRSPKILKPYGKGSGLFEHPFASQAGSFPMGPVPGGSRQGVLFRRGFGW